MANPQKEDGYTAIANEIMDALIASDLSGQDFKVSLLIIRKTYGFNKVSDSVSLTQMMAATGMCKVRCSQVVNRLELMKILTVTENINGIGKKYKFNKDFETWTTVKENINRLEKTKLTVNEKRNRPLMKTLTTKDNITKDNIQKTYKLPDGLSKKTFDEFLKLRKKKRAPLLEESYPRFFKQLEKVCLESRASPEDIINQSLVYGYQGIFPLKTRGNNGNGSKSGITRSTGTPFTKTGGAQSDGEPWPEDRQY